MATMTVIREFKTAAEASVFMEGLDYVNDSSIDILGSCWDENLGKYVVLFEDNWDED